jgi:membrane protein
VFLLCLSFGVVYRLIPNTHVRWDAAIVGGVVGGVLWQLNNYFSFLYVSRWVTNSKIYGSLAAAPVFLVGVYVSWLIVLFGAQVAYAFQNRAEYLQEKQAQNINQRGREFIALRLMECVGQRFQRGEPPATTAQMADALSVPACLVHEIMESLMASRLVVEIAGEDPAFAPARPLEAITCHDILLALRAGQGQELETREDHARNEVFGEFEKILEAEKKAASSVNIMMMVNRTEKLLAGHRVKAVTDHKPD